MRSCSNNSLKSSTSAASLSASTCLFADGDFVPTIVVSRALV